MALGNVYQVYQSQTQHHKRHTNQPILTGAATVFCHDRPHKQNDRIKAPRVQQDVMVMCECAQKSPGQYSYELLSLTTTN
jgi:hypothetical protein